MIGNPPMMIEQLSSLMLSLIEVLREVKNESFVL